MVKRVKWNALRVNLGLLPATADAEKFELKILFLRGGYNDLDRSFIFISLFFLFVSFRLSAPFSFFFFLFSFLSPSFFSSFTLSEGRR